jgi:GTP-binding protein YchF
MLRAGLIGLPSTGKTTLFQLLTGGHPDAPAGKSGKFGRADAQIGVSPVPDPRLDRLTALFEPKKHASATVTFADLAGSAAARSIIDLSTYRDADALLHVVRAFRADDVPHVSETVDPGRDARAVEDELILADLSVAEKRLDRIKHDRKKGASKELDLEAAVIERCRTHLEEGLPIRGLDLDPAAAKVLRGFQFLSAKPLLLVINLDEADIHEAERAAELTGLGDVLVDTHTRAVGVCAKIELEIAQLEAGDAKEFMADLGLEAPGLDRVIKAAYDLLGYISFFTVGKDECRAWSIPKGTKAQQAAGEIHTDIERGFIRAEVVGCEPLLQRGTIAACRDKAEVRLEGKEYLVKDGDVINFRFAT